MSELHLPWLEIAILLPLAGALWVRRLLNPDRARGRTLVVAGLTFIATAGAWLDFSTLRSFEAHDHWDAVTQLLHTNLFVIDELNAPLLPLASLIYLLTVLATLRTKVHRFSFALTLVGESIVLATLACKQPWALIALMSLGAIIPWIELRRRHKPTRVYKLHMGLFVGMLVLGQGIVDLAGSTAQPQILGVICLATAVLLRSGVVPLHCWMTDLFENASFGTALLFVSRLIGPYAAMRLVFPIAPAWVLEAVAFASLLTALYAAGMALVQSDSRRFFTYLFLSHSSLILVGVEIATPIGLTGALCLWLSVGLSLTGFGLILRAVESRTGRLALDRFHGLYEHMPRLAMFFLFTGLASIGFPGTIGFVGAELLVEGAVEVSPWVGALVVITSAINGLAIMHAYFRVFTGTRHPGTADLQARPAEKAAVLILTILILGGGLYPQPGISSRYHAAVELSKSRTSHPFRESEVLPPESSSATDSPARSPKSAATSSRTPQISGAPLPIQAAAHIVD